MCCFFSMRFFCVPNKFEGATDCFLILPKLETKNNMPFFGSGAHVATLVFFKSLDGFLSGLHQRKLRGHEILLLLLFKTWLTLDGCFVDCLPVDSKTALRLVLVVSVSPKFLRRRNKKKKGFAEKRNSEKKKKKRNKQRNWWTLPKMFVTWTNNPSTEAQIQKK